MEAQTKTQKRRVVLLQVLKHGGAPRVGVGAAGAAARNESAASAGDGRQEVQVTAMVPIQLPVLGNLACRLLDKVLVWVAR